jgi:hypothetical protein
MRAIETTFQQGVSADSLQRSAHLKNNKVKANRKTKNKATAKSSDSTKNAQQIVNNIKNALNAKDYSKGNFLIHTLANDQQDELSEIRLFWLQAT